MAIRETGMFAEEPFEGPSVSLSRGFASSQEQEFFVFLLPLADGQGLVGIDRLNARRGFRADVFLRKCLIIHWNFSCFLGL